MPELPEVETVRRGLKAAIEGAVIKKALLRRKNMRTAFPVGLAETLSGSKITAIRRRAKYLLFDLDSGDTVIAHLGMSGHFSVCRKAPKNFSAHDHVVWELKDGRCVIFNDPRRFGLMTITRTKELSSHPLLASLGAEPLEKDFSSEYLKEILSKRKAPVKATLMDQRLVVGVGNIYASEALFDAKIDPRKSSQKVAVHAKKLAASVQQVLRDALKSGGSSLRDFLHVSGEVGHFQHHFKVYGREGKPCVICGTKIQNIRLSGRSTFYCPHCQK